MTAIRPARATDAADIRGLIHRVGINPTGLDWRRFLVAVNDRDELLGCGQLKPHGPDILELASIAVQPEYQGQGVARLLIERLLNGSPRPLYLMCQSSLGSFYEKFGFHVISSDEMPRYFRRMSRLAGLFMALAQREERLLIMKLQ